MVALLAVWLAAAVGGSAYLARYAARPAAAGTLVRRWPEGDMIARADHGQTLMMFLHPRCPCSRASLRELDRLLGAAPKALAAIVVMIEPPGAGQGWAETDLLASAKAIAGVRVIVDERGQIAERFGARTSGEVGLYDEQGRLLFQGGITPARGHEGDSLGREAILLLVRHQPAGSCSPAFGCPLVSTSQYRP